VCCSVVKCVAVCTMSRRVLLSVAEWRRVLQRVAVWCSLLQCVPLIEIGVLGRDTNEVQ